MCFHKRTKIKVRDRAFRFTEAGKIHAIGHGLILQIAFPPLITNRTIERVVDQEELHNALTRFLDHRGICFDHRRCPFRPRAQVLDLHRTGRRRFGGTPHNFNQAHPAIPSDGKPFVIAKPWDLNPRSFAGLDQRHRWIDLNFLLINDNRPQLGHPSFTSSCRNQFPFGSIRTQKPASKGIFLNLFQA